MLQENRASCSRGSSEIQRGIRLAFLIQYAYKLQAMVKKYLLSSLFPEERP